MWLRLTAIPNPGHLDVPRAHILVNTERVLMFMSRPGEAGTQLDFSTDQSTPTICVAESLEDIERLVGHVAGVGRRQMREMRDQATEDALQTFMNRSRTG